MPTIKITDEHAAALMAIAKKNGTTPAQAFATMIKQASAPASPAAKPIAPASPAVDTDTAAHAARYSKHQAVNAAMSTPPGVDAKVIDALNENAAAADAEDGDKRPRSGKASPLALRIWAQEPTDDDVATAKKVGLKIRNRRGS